MFDFLNKGVTDTIQVNIRNRELAIARDLITIERTLDKLSMYLDGWNIDID